MTPGFPANLPAMAILSYNEIVQKKVIEYNNEPYEVLSSHVFRMQQRKPVNQTKLRHLVSGKVTEISFHQNESVPEADIETMQAVYLYTNRGESWFTESGNPKNRFSFPGEHRAQQGAVARPGRAGGGHALQREAGHPSTSL